MIKSNKVYLNPSTGKFIETKSVNGDSVTCSGFAMFYEDAKTNILRQELSIDYIIDNFISPEPLDKCAFVDFQENVNGWKAIKLNTKEETQ